MVTPPDAGRSRRRMIINIALAVVGGALLLATVRRVGWHDVQRGVTDLGWWFAAIVLLGGLRFTARARAWMACAAAVLDTPHSAPSTPHAAPGTGTSHAAPSTRTQHPAPGTKHYLSAVLAADAVGNLTPLGLLASEPAKILLVRGRLPMPVAIASVAAENAFYIASVVVMLAAGAAVFLTLAGLPGVLRTGGQVVLAAAVGSLAAAVIVARHRPAVLSWLARPLSAVTGRRRTSTEHLQEIETHFYGLLTWPASRIARVMGWEAFFHAAAVAEVFLVLRLLPGGEGITLVQAFVLEATGRLIAVAFKFVPYRLGVDEAGSALVARALAIDPTAGVTLALVRRLRILCWNALGLFVLARSR